MKIRGLFADGIVMTQARRPAMKKKYIVTLTEEERPMLRDANCGLRIDPQRTIIPGVTPRPCGKRVG